VRDVFSVGEVVLGSRGQRSAVKAERHPEAQARPATETETGVTHRYRWSTCGDLHSVIGASSSQGTAQSGGGTYFLKEV